MKKYSLDYTNYNTEKNDFNHKIDYYKIIFLGNSSSGKTTIINYIIDDYFYKNINQTIGIDFKFKDIDIQLYKDINSNTITKYKKFEKLLDLSNDMRLFFIDTPDYSRFYNLNRLYLKNNKLYVIVIDITKELDSNIINNYINDILIYNNNPIIYFIANIFYYYLINYESLNYLKSFCKTNNYFFIDINCSIGYNIKYFLNHIIYILISNKYKLKDDTQLNDYCCNIF